MASHNLFYYPYASFTTAQLPLLKVAALYFDKLVILDPVGANWETIGVDQQARDAVRLLEHEHILEVVKPSDVLKQYEGSIAAAIRRDMSDQAFLDLCRAHSLATGKERWNLSLAKVPADVQADQQMQHLMGDFAREVSRESGRFQDQIGVDPTDYYEYSETGAAYDEVRDGYGGTVEYRLGQVPLALGEAIMMNHVLFAGLLHAGATPVTDDSFHSDALALKLRRASQENAVENALTDHNHARQLKADLFAAKALTDPELTLPILNPELPLSEVLEYRQHADVALRQARARLGNMARSIRAEPWTTDFASELEHTTLPDLVNELDKARKARDAWLASRRGRLALSAAGIAFGTAAVVLSVVAAPLTPIALASAGVGLASGTVIPSAAWLLDWRDGKKTDEENGLHYLLKT